MTLITEVEITGLNGYLDLLIPLRGRHCILVGPNGSGKSTALQIIAYALGRQWKALGTSRFDRLGLSFADGRRALLSREACLSFSRAVGGNPRFSRLARALADADALEAFIAADLGRATTREAFSNLLKHPEADLRVAQQYLRRSSGSKVAQKEVLDFQRELDESAVPPTLYLPTYRRIELELDKMFSDVQEYYQKQVVTQLKTGVSTDFLVELVRFGMEDVAGSIQSFERATRDFARTRFNRMMTSYLKEMANSQVLSVGDLRSRHIDERTIEIVLSRIEEGLLSPEEKAQISNIILDLSSGPGAGNQPFNKKWLAHFFVRLLEVNRDIEEKEGPITSFVQALDKYFYPKTVNYDIENYHFSIRSETHAEIKLSDLSSGEKQIVSILSQFFLSTSPSKNVCIDEPELSLSVPWQSDLLPDIAQTKTCNQVFAVTHSPFIYDNALAGTVVDFLEARQN